jgi:hypothetical protein
MMRFAFLKLVAAGGLLLAAPAAGFAQSAAADPSGSGEYEPVADAPAPQPVQERVDPGSQDPAPAPYQAPAGVAPTPSASPHGASDRASEAMKIPRDDVLGAAEGVFGKGAEGLADLIEDLLRDQGEPSAYITGREAGGAFVAGIRYGSGTLHHQIEGDRPIYWTGPSVGFDFGADANKVFVLVYNLNDGQDIFKRYPQGEGNAYVVGGLTAGYLRRGSVVLIPIRMGVGVRLGVNAGYMKFSEKSRWLPF